MSAAPTSGFETLALERLDEHVTIVRLNRPDASNALNTQMGNDLVRCFEDVALDPAESALHRPDRIRRQSVLRRRRPEGAPRHDR